MAERSIWSYQDLDVWQVAMKVAEQCYRLTQTFPKEELFGLTAQIRRAAASVAANIAEGYGRESRREYLQFLRIAQGSQKELETYLLLAIRVGITTENAIAPVLSDCERVGKMLHRLIRSLQFECPTSAPCVCCQHTRLRTANRRHYCDANNEPSKIFANRLRPARLASGRIAETIRRSGQTGDDKSVAGPIPTQTIERQRPAEI